MVNFPPAGRFGRSAVRGDGGVAAAVRGAGEVAAAVRGLGAARVRPESCSGLVEALRIGGLGA